MVGYFHYQIYLLNTFGWLAQLMINQKVSYFFFEFWPHGHLWSYWWILTCKLKQHGKFWKLHTYKYHIKLQLFDWQTPNLLHSIFLHIFLFTLCKVSSLRPILISFIWNFSIVLSEVFYQSQWKKIPHL